MKKLLFFVLLFGLYFLTLPTTNVYASVLLYDNFNQGKLPNWQESYGFLGSWNIVDGEYVGYVARDGSDTPTYSLNGNKEWTNYRFKVRIRGDIGVDKVILFRFNSFSETYAIKLCSSWPDSYGDKVILHKNNLIGWTNSATFVNHIGNWYNLDVRVQDNNIKLYIDESTTPIIDYVDESSPSLSGKIGLLVWPGGYGGYATQNSFDDVLVCDLEGPCEIPTPTTTPTPTLTPTPTITPTPTPTPSPSPTPTSSPLKPIVILPGLGGSWNHEKIVHGINQPQGNWYKPFFVNTYDGLIKTFENAGYQINNNLFVFYYDSFQPVEKSAEDLKNYINNVVKPAVGVKINLVGHSLGGLVGRTYLQNNSINSINKLITLGTPHKGVVQAYKAWEGADLNGLLTGVEKIGAEILLQVRSLNYPNQVKAIQDIVPSFKDILFTENYLKNQNGIIKTESSLRQQNIWLKNLGISSETNNLTSTIVGTNIDTPRWLKVKPQSLTDRILGRWEDGNPVSQEKASGDKTVLDESAKINNVNLITLNNVDHGDLVKSIAGQQKILDILGLTSSGIVPVTDNIQEPILVFALASPAYFKVIGPDGKQIGENTTGTIIPNAFYSKDEKMIIIPNYKSGKYQVVVTSLGIEEYKLLVGQLNSYNDIWTSYKESRSKNFIIDIDKSLKSTPKYLIKQINSKLDQLISDLPKKHPRSIFAGIVKMKLEKIQENLDKGFDDENDINKVQIKTTETAIKDLDNAIRFAQLKDINTTIPDLREIMNLLTQVYDLLESNNH